MEFLKENSYSFCTYHNESCQYWSTENKSKQIKYSILALKQQQILGVILCFFMHLRWPWLLRFFVEIMQKPFKFKIKEIKEIQIASTAFLQSHGHFRYIKDIKLYQGIVALMSSLCIHSNDCQLFPVQLLLFCRSIMVLQNFIRPMV